MSDVEALTGILNAVLQSGGIHGRNFGEFTNYSVDEYPMSMLQEMWSWGFPIAVTKTTPNSTPVRTYVPMEGLADIVADVEGFLRQRMCHAPYVLFPLDELGHHDEGGMTGPRATNTMGESLNIQGDAVEPLFRDLEVSVLPRIWIVIEEPEGRRVFVLVPLASTQMSLDRPSLLKITYL